MGATELLATRVTPDIKKRVTGVVREEFLTESIWLRRLVLRELQVVASEDGAHRRRDERATLSIGSFSNKRAPGSSLSVRLKAPASAASVKKC
jgi:uncharacterized protein YacL